MSKGHVAYLCPERRKTKKSPTRTPVGNRGRPTRRATAPALPGAPSAAASFFLSAKPTRSLPLLGSAGWARVQTLSPTRGAAQRRRCGYRSWSSEGSVMMWRMLVPLKMCGATKSWVSDGLDVFFSRRRRRSSLCSGYVRDLRRSRNSAAPVCPASRTGGLPPPKQRTTRHKICVACFDYVEHSASRWKTPQLDLVFVFWEFFFNIYIEYPGMYFRSSHNEDACLVV